MADKELKDKKEAYEKPKLQKEGDLKDITAGGTGAMKKQPPP